MLVYSVHPRPNFLLVQWHTLNCEHDADANGEDDCNQRPLICIFGNLLNWVDPVKIECSRPESDDEAARVTSLGLSSA